ncbi:MAG: hypothetical protein V3T02_03840 [Alphaproteobacteria bacterium]
MTLPTKRRRTLPLLVFLLCLVLGYAVYRALESTDYGGSTEVALSRPEKIPALAPQPRFAMPPITTYPETVKRPLFSPSRQPPEQTTEIPEPKPVPDQDIKARLSGIIITPEGRFALLQKPQETEAIRIREGQNFEGWVVKSIQADRIVLNRGESTQVVMIEDEIRKAPAATRRKPRRSRRNRARTPRTRTPTP